MRSVTSTRYVVRVDTRPAFEPADIQSCWCTYLQFPEVMWFAFENLLFAQMSGGYTLSFERVLAQWEAGNFDQIRPSDRSPSHSPD